MATFRVQNLTDGKLAVPPPLDVVLVGNQTENVEAASADTPAIQDMLDRGLIALVRVTDGLPGESAEAANLGLVGAASETALGSISDPVVLGAGQTATLSHDLGTKASTVDVYDSDGANFTAAADIVVAQADADTLAVTSTAGGSFVIVASFEAGVTNDMGSALASTDDRIAVA